VDLVTLATFQAPTGELALAEYRRLTREIEDRLGEQSAELSELHRDARRIVEGILGQMVLGAERARVSMLRLRELSSASELLMHAPAEAAFAADFDRVVLSRVEEGHLLATSMHLASDPDRDGAALQRLQGHPIPFEFPLVEGEVMRLRRPRLLTRNLDDPEGRYAFAAAIGCDNYVAAPMTLEGKVVGFLHGDRERTRRSLSEVDRDALGMFAVAFAAVYERALLRHRLLVQRQAMREVALWADARTSELSDWPLTLTPDATDSSAEELIAQRATSANALTNLLTRRERDVLELMVKGETNATIARALFVTEGTVKFHVKNILRKMRVANRSEAVSRYLRSTLAGS
jgi:DNA-binding CsgD family transcriptional regulator